MHWSVLCIMEHGLFLCVCGSAVRFGAITVNQPPVLEGVSPQK